MKIRVKYFASFRELAGKSEETIEINTTDLGRIFDDLSERYHFKMRKEDVKTALNQNYVSWETTIKENDLVVFIPPVAGG